MTEQITFTSPDSAHAFALAVINLSVDELLKAGFTLPQIIDALQDYTKAAQIAAQGKGTMQ